MRLAHVRRPSIPCASAKSCWNTAEYPSRRLTCLRFLAELSKIKDNDPRLKAKLEEIRSYVKTDKVPDASLVRMARLGAVIDDWMENSNLVASALQCWTSVEEYYGIVPCTLMSMMSNSLMPSACETDISGLVGMYAMVLASGQAQRPGGLE